MSSRSPRRTADIRRSALTLLRELDIGVPLDPAVLCERLGAQRGRPIHLAEHRFAHSPIFGLWVGTPEADHVFVERETTPAHQRHIVLHEVGHIVFDHGGEGGEDLWSELAAALPPGMVANALPRGSYDTASEYEAELFASIVEGWAAAMTTTRGQRDERSALTETFDDPWGWR